MPVRDPFSEWKPFTGKSHRSLTADIVCAHTMVGKLIGSWNWANQDGHSYWHYGLGANGRLLQCVGLEYRSAANLEGNWHVIPIETEDGFPDGRTSDSGQVWAPWAGSNVPAWTQPQVDRLVELCAWLCERFAIPPVLIPDTRQGRRGLAYHRQGIDPWRVSGGERWSTATGKVCPGDRRLAQFRDIVVPEVARRVNKPTPPPTPKPLDGDGMFAYTITHDGNDYLILVSSGKQVRVNGATVGDKIRSADYYIGGPVDSHFAGWLEDAYGSVIGF